MDTAKLEEMVYSALTGNDELMGLLSQNDNSIFHLQAPAQYPDYPILVYAPISDVPVLHGDNSETLHVVTIRIHIINGTPAIYENVLRIMQELGFVRTLTTPFIEDGRLIQAVDFYIVSEVV